MSVRTVITFEEWMLRVDQEILRRVGITHKDLVD